jgi:FkbM family methyltransferase
VRLPWTAQFIHDWWPYLSLSSIARLRDQELRTSAGATRAGRRIALDVQQPFRARVVVRERGSDLLTFEEIVRAQVYRGVTDGIGDCRTIIDLGANIGLASLYLAARFANSRIVAVEPNPDTYQLLVANLARLTRSGRCRTVQGAVWSASRTLRAAPIEDAEHYSAFAVREASGPETEPEIMGISIQQLIEISGFGFVDLLKVDIEGAEVELFRADLRWLMNVGAIAIEFHKDARAQCSFDAIMKDHGFSVVSDAPHTVIAVRR